MSNRKFVISVNHCGAKLCGKIAKLREPTYANGKRKVDKHNPYKSLRERPLIGLALLIDMKPAGQKAWKGKIYNPDDGETYRATVDVNGDVMKVRGCVASVLCKTVTFLRQP